MSTPGSSLSCLNKNHEHLCLPNVDLLGQKREQRNSSHARRTSWDGSSPSPRKASAIRIVGLAFRKAAKHPIFLFLWICPVVSKPVRAYQLIKTADFSGPSLLYIGYRKTLRRLSLVPMISAELLASSSVLRRAKSSTSMSCEYNYVNILLLLVTSTAW